MVCANIYVSAEELMLEQSKDKKGGGNAFSSSGVFIVFPVRNQKCDCALLMTDTTHRQNTHTLVEQ
jgi:hypothetical protein